MNDVTRLLVAIDQGDPEAADRLLPLVYDELRRLASRHLGRERTGQTLQPTALVHEAYLRLVGDAGPRWDGRHHFYIAAARAMQHILVDRARRKGAAKRGGGRRRVPLEDFHRVEESPADLLDLDDALTRLAEADPAKARLVQLRFFAGLSTAEAAEALGVSLATAERWWAFARAWLYDELDGEGEDRGAP